MSSRDGADLLDFVDWRTIEILRMRRRNLSNMLRNFGEDTYTKDDEGHRQLWPLSSIDETNEEVIVSVDLPYVSKENIEIEAMEDSILIHAKMDRHIKFSSHKEGDEAEFDCHCKSVQLPPAIRADVSNAQAIFRNGILQIRLPKKRNGTRINIK
jgi:HSP20 family molecular chaperone IbpA